MAAGMGSRFGGLKQIAPVDEKGHIIIDFSLFDAWRAGFRDLVFIIKPEMEASFREVIGSRMEQYFNITYVHQTIEKLPAGYTVPEGREKPWGTGHAVLCCKDVVDSPFVVINADDFYGPTAFAAIYDYLVSNKDPSGYAMVGYRVRNTVTENGSVARGVCEVENGLLTGVTERTKIFKNGMDARYTEDGETFVDLPGDTIVSMNFWGFTPEIFAGLEEDFIKFLADPNRDPLKGESLLPNTVFTMMQKDMCDVAVLTTTSKWFGVTYSEDKPDVIAKLNALIADGVYPDGLWK